MEILKYVPLLELLALITMVLIRSIMLRRWYGTKAIVFGNTDKSDFIIVPIILFVFYGIVASIFNLPYPTILARAFFEIAVLPICAIVLCSIALVWFGITLGAFGRSFRVGIDTNTDDKLVTSGTFAISRNPIYLAFIVFFLGIFLIYPNITTSVGLVFIVAMVHRQILREEKFLQGHYGEEYEDYCKQVRRYL